MTPDEKSLLSNFLRDLQGARGGPKDAEAEALIQQALAANPDGAYLLVQHAIVADQSLHAAQARIAELENQMRGPHASSSFLPQAGGSPWGGGGAQAGYAPPPPDQRPGIFSGGGGLGSFLRNAGTTAAGIAGGEMLFNGLSDLFGGGHRGGFLGGGGGGPEEVVVNNFVDDDDRDFGPGDPNGW